MAFLAPMGAALGTGAGAAGAGAAGSGLATSAIGSAGGLSESGLAGALGSNPLLSAINPSMVTGASSAIPTGGSGLMGGLKGGLSALNSGLDPLSKMKELMGSGSSAPPAMQFPQLQHSQGTPMTPPPQVSSAGIAGPLNSGRGMSPQLMKLIQLLQGGGGM